MNSRLVEELEFAAIDRVSKIGFQFKPFERRGTHVRIENRVGSLFDRFCLIHRDIGFSDEIERIPVVGRLIVIPILAVTKTSRPSTEKG